MELPIKLCCFHNGEKRRFPALVIRSPEQGFEKLGLLVKTAFGLEDAVMTWTDEDGDQRRAHGATAGLRRPTHNSTAINGGPKAQARLRPRVARANIRCTVHGAPASWRE